MPVSDSWMTMALFLMDERLRLLQMLQRFETDELLVMSEGALTFNLEDIASKFEDVAKLPRHQMVKIRKEGGSPYAPFWEDDQKAPELLHAYEIGSAWYHVVRRVKASHTSLPGKVYLLWRGGTDSYWEMLGEIGDYEPPTKASPRGKRGE